VIRLELLNVDNQSIEVVDPNELDRLVRNPESLLWIDLVDPTPDDFALLAREFNFHPLALEDAQMRGQRPKLDQYDDFIFMVFYDLAPVDTPLAFTAQELSLFIGRNYLVSVHSDRCPAIEETAKRWKANSSALQGKGIAVLLYSLLDTIVDGYFPSLDSVAEQVDALEETIFSGKDRGALQSLFQLRKNLLRMRRVLAPERDLMGLLVRRDLEALGPATAVYFQDIYDHVLRVTDALDTYRDLLAGALDAYLSVVSNNLNQVMRTLTAWSIILMTLTIVPSVYGMNFHLFPSQDWPHGFSYAVVLMAILGSGLFMMFRRIRWL
jgi:magnesium transporter